MLGIDHQHGRFGSSKPGADPGILSGEWGGSIYGAAASRGVPLGGTDPGAARVRQSGAGEQGIGAAVCGANDRAEPGASDSADRRASPDGTSEGGRVSTHQVRDALHVDRRGITGLRGQSARKSKRSGDPADPRARVRRVWPGRLPAAGPDLGGADLPIPKLGHLSQAQRQLSADAAHGDSHWRTAQTAAARLAWIPAHRHRAPRRSGWPQGHLSHQRGRPSNAMGDRCRHTADLGVMADSIARNDASTVSVCDPRPSTPTTAASSSTTPWPSCWESF